MNILYGLGAVAFDQVLNIPFQPNKQTMNQPTKVADYQSAILVQNILDSVNLLTVVRPVARLQHFPNSL